MMEVCGALCSNSADREAESCIIHMVLGVSVSHQPKIDSENELLGLKNGGRCMILHSQSLGRRTLMTGPHQKNRESNRS